MRRVVTALVLVMLAVALVACGAPADTGAAGSTGTSGTAGVPLPPASAAGSASTRDTLSPTQTVGVNEMFPTDTSTVPADIAANLTAKKPMLIFFYDPTTKAASDQRAEIDAALRKYRGTIDLIALDYTAGLPSDDASATLGTETQKIELLSAALGVNTTPFIVFVDSSGRVTYKFAGYVDRQLLTREVLRATE